MWIMQNQFLPNQYIPNQFGHPVVNQLPKTFAGARTCPLCNTPRRTLQAVNAGVYAVGKGKYMPYNSANTDGPQFAAGILFSTVAGGIDDTLGVIMAHNPEISKSELGWAALLDAYEPYDLAILRNHFQKAAGTASIHQDWHEMLKVM